ncbi:MAG: hypothetical protein ABFD14_10770 [Anaerolineaceae bacterium]
MKLRKAFSFKNLLAIAVLLLLGYLIGMASQNPVKNVQSQATLATENSLIPTLQLTDQNIELPSEAVDSNLQVLSKEGIFAFSMVDGNYFHLFAYHPVYLSLTRLTNDAWDDCYPALSPDGTQLAFASNRDGAWDIYILNLSNNAITRLTNSLAYDSRPSWSPDGQWITYESYINDNLEIVVQSTTDPTQPVLQLTDDTYVDHAPSWSPIGRTIAFVSNRSGSEDIWLASLDQTNDRFKNISQTPDALEFNPAWSPDGSQLAWSKSDGNITTMWISDLTHLPRQMGDGSLPTWNPQADQLGGILQTPNDIYLVGYHIQDTSISIQPMHLWGEVRGLVWGNGLLAQVAVEQNKSNSAALPVVLWQVETDTTASPPAGRDAIVPVAGVEAPYAFLDDYVDEAFSSLKNATAVETGWDFLASLENMYTPLTQPVQPGVQQDWLITGRGIAVNPVSYYAGWMAVSREDYFGATYWRIYLKARNQDGSQGEPIAHSVWDFTARYSGNTVGYEQGGQYQNPPAGYWIDFTSLANRYGWSRLPSEGNWRTYFEGTRFNQFVLSGGLSWYEAMVKVYPPEVLTSSDFAPYLSATPKP